MILDQYILHQRQFIVKDFRRDTPCKKFVLSSNGPVSMYAPNKLGTYELENTGYNGRVAYTLRTQTNVFHLVLLTEQTDEESVSYWMVRLAKKIFTVREFLI